MLKNFAAIAFALGLFTWVAVPACAEESQALSETEEAAAEDAAAAKLDGEVKSPLTGIGVKGQYIAQPAGEDAPAIQGYLKNKDHVYIIKTDAADVRKALEKLSGKEVNLFGKERNKGKYLIVLNIIADEDKPQERRKRRGF